MDPPKASWSLMKLRLVNKLLKVPAKGAGEGDRNNETKTRIKLLLITLPGGEIPQENARRLYYGKRLKTLTSRWFLATGVSTSENSHTLMRYT